MPTYAAILEAFAGTGLLVRGGFVARDDEALPAGPDGNPAGAIVLLGNAGGDLWPAFSAGRRDEPHPLDEWARRTVDPAAARLDARTVYPNDRPWHPFQQWALRAEPVAPSPIGLLIHPDYGLWHAYRAALLLDEAPAGPAAPDRPARAVRHLRRPAVPERLPRRRPLRAPDSTCPPARATCAAAPRRTAWSSAAARATAARSVATAGSRTEQVTFHMQAFLRSRP